MFVVFFKIFYGLIVSLPTSKSLSFNWNFGSFIFIIYIFQILSGLFLVFFFSNDSVFSFSSVQYLMFEVNFGWAFRLLHFNGASFFFFLVFLHFFKGLFFFSYRLKRVWFIGILIFLVLMAVAFMGYVLVWAQMSFWATVVITSLLTVIPFFGLKIVFWIWGGFSVSGPTLKFFFVIHFLLPWLLIIFIFLHLFFLHNTGSTNKLFYCGGLMKFSFYSFFWLKDFYNFLFFFLFFVFFLVYPFSLGDPEMFSESDFLNSPVHIVPEWYFLFAYAVLRSIPNKVLGVFFLVFSLLIFFLFLFFFNFMPLFSVFNKFLVFWFLFIGVFLSWIGQCVVEFPFFSLGVIFTVLYFFLVFLMFLNYISSYFFFLYLL